MKMRKRWGIRWHQVPWSLWAYVVLTTGGIVRLVLTVSGPVGPLIFVIAFILAWNYFLLRALRWLWIATIVVFALFSVIDLLNGTSNWFGTLLGLVELALLLLPPTRRFFKATDPPLVLEREQ